MFNLFSRTMYLLAYYSGTLDQVLSSTCKEMLETPDPMIQLALAVLEAEPTPRDEAIEIFINGFLDGLLQTEEHPGWVLPRIEKHMRKELNILLETRTFTHSG